MVVTNWYLYIPSVISIYLILISNIFNRFLRNSVANYIGGRRPLVDHQEFIQNVALDWSARFGFVNSIIAAIFSVIATYLQLRNYNWAVLTFIPFVLLFIPMFVWLLRLNPGDLVAIRSRFLNLTHDTLCSIILFVVNLILIGAIYVSSRIA
jgi:hypothetical protein